MIDDDLLAGNPIWIVDVGASGGVHPRWRNLSSNYKTILFEPNPVEYKKYNELAKIYIKKGKYAEAEKLLTISIQNYPYDNEAQEILESIAGGNE